MSDRRQVTYEDFFRFYEAKVSVLQCPCCGANDWALSEDTPLPADPTRFIGPGLVYCAATGEISASAHTCVMVVVCMSCGFLRLHDRKIVIEWLDNNPIE